MELSDIQVYFICFSIELLITYLIYREINKEKELVFFPIKKLLPLLLCLPIFHCVIIIIYTFVLDRCFLEGEVIFSYVILFYFAIVEMYFVVVNKFEWTEEKIEIRKRRELAVCFFF